MELTDVEKLGASISTPDCKVSTAASCLNSDAKYIYPLGVSPIDNAIGGGFHSGKIYEIYGLESHGKSTIALEASKAFTKFWAREGTSPYAVLWLETESVFDKIRAAYMGCDITKYLVCEAKTIEQGFDVIEKTLAKCKAQGVKLFIVWDTIAACPTQNEKDKEGQWGGGMMELPRILRFALRKLTTPLGETDSTFIAVNQVYMAPGQFTSTMEARGGGAFKFHASCRIEVKKVEELKKIMPSGDDVTEAIVTEIYTKKNKLTLPHQRVKIVIGGETGINRFETVARYIINNKLIVAAGSWKKLAYKDETISFQSNHQLKELGETRYTDLDTWMDYMVCQHFTTISPLIKVKLLGQLWDYEKLFLGDKKTTVDGKELDIAKMLYAEIQKEEDDLKTAAILAAGE